MQVYAVYGRDKWVLMVLICMSLSSAVVCALQSTRHICLYHLHRVFLYPYLIFQDIHSKLECKGGIAACVASFGLGRNKIPFTDVAAYYWSYLTYPIASVSWLVMSMVELLLFVLVLKKASYSYNMSFKRREKPTLDECNPDIMTIIARDSIAYFAVCVIVYV